jgi:putative tryptophan/tyrosine transport system substrate-binding protein
MRRRDFVTFLGGATAWPLAARAQQPERIRRVGLLMSTGNPENDPESRARIAALREGLEKLGWTEGHNIELDYRWARGDPDRVQMLAKELVVLRPDVIVAVTTTGGVALKRETTTIPVVFVNVVDPMVAVVAMAARTLVGGVPGVAMTATPRPTRSTASSGMRSY